MTYEQELLLDKYREQRFDDDQLDEIKRGIENGVDVDMYAHKEITAATMCKIRRHMQERRDNQTVAVQGEGEDEFEKIDSTYAKREELLENEHYERIFTAALTVGILCIVGTLIAVVLMYFHYLG